MCYYFFKINAVSWVTAGLVWLVTGLPAANWYVDPGATGSNNGSSWSNAWTGFSSITWGSSGVKGGDYLYLSGGSTSRTYTQTLTIGASGTAAAPLRVRIGQEAGHNGTARFTGAGINLNSRSYIQLDGSYNGQNRIAVSGVDIGVSGGASGNEICYVDLDNVGMGITVNGTGNDIHHNNLTNIHGGSGMYACIRVSGGSSAFDANKVHHNAVHVLTSPINGYGPDGIQTSSGTSVYHNRFTVSRAGSALPTPEHPDVLQSGGSNYLKVYGNEFIDVGDACIQLGVWFNHNYNNVWIYNNIFRIVNQLDSYPEYIRLYAGDGGVLGSINNLKIMNNVFVDNSNKYYPLRFVQFGGNPTGTGNEIKNNIFYNMGLLPTYPVIIIDASTGWTDNSWQFANNLYYGRNGLLPYVSYAGQAYSITQWKAFKEPSAVAEAPQFVSYTLNGADNDYHLAPGDTACRDRGVDLSAYFTLDRDGVPRPQGAAWDIGAYEGAATGIRNGKIDMQSDAFRLTINPQPIRARELNQHLREQAGLTVCKLSGNPVQNRVLAGPGVYLVKNASSNTTQKVLVVE